LSQLSSTKTIVVALAGNPNSGKTTIFNHLTGAHQHVGNYPGVTVEKKEGVVSYGGMKIKFVDLPGTYSLSAHSVEEIIARNSIIQNAPDVVVNVVDASNIERNLYLTTQLFELGRPVLVALNMSDMAQSRGINIDIDRISDLLGVPIVPTVGNKGRGMQELLRAVVHAAQDCVRSRPQTVSFRKDFEGEISKLTRELSVSGALHNGYQPRWVALKLLENDAEISKYLVDKGVSQEVLDTARTSGERAAQLYNSTPSEIISDDRYGFISGACSEAVSLEGEHRHNISDKIDLLMIHPKLGILVFAALMWLVFQLTFTLGEIPMGWIESGIGLLSTFMSDVLPEGLFRSLIVDGIIGGVGGVIVFLPNIMLLFLAIALLEDTGYMARAAFVMDRVMHKIGLHGKSFIPMLIGFGCSVPAYMGSRILEDKTDRLVTMHVTTFMSCGARLPVYILVCGAFWPENAGNVVFSIYLLGILVAVGFVKLLRSTRFKGMSAEFIMELPPYRVPTLRSLAIHMWERSWLYLRKAGTVILGISIVMWFLMTFPERSEFDQDYGSMIAQVETDRNSGAIDPEAAEERVLEIETMMVAEQARFSFAGQIGRFIEPVIKPLGFDWRMGVALISGFMAKEVVVSTMGTLYGVGEADETSESLRESLANDAAYSKLIAYSFLVFVLLYMPCMAAMAVFAREAGSVKEVTYQLAYTCALAWGGSFIVYQGGKLLGLG